jgi:myo-inositol-1(or 4)-monophosphatase
MTALARNAGVLARQYFSKIDALLIESKGHQDLVSNADREVETFIRTNIAASYPDDGITGEEHGRVEGTSGHVWIIDPIDGTANFVRGIPAWCVVIACTFHGDTIAGAIYRR